MSELSNVIEISAKIQERRKTLVDSAASTDRATRYLALIAGVAGQLLAATDPARMVDDLFVLIQTELRLDVFFNYRFANGRLELEAHAGLSDAEAAAGATLEIGQAVCGCAARDRLPIHATGVQQSDEPLVAFVKDLGLDAYACTPLVQGDTLLGTLGFGRRWAARFEEEELNFLHTICDYVALAKHRLRVERDLREALIAKDHVLAELNHRVRNALQLVIGMLALEERDGSTAEARVALAHARDRILVVAAVHQRLYEDNEPNGIEIGGLLRDLARDIAAAYGIGTQFVAEGDHVLVVERAVALALALDELLRARLAGRTSGGPVIRLRLDHVGVEHRLTIEDDGAAPDVPPHASYDRVMKALLRQLGGSLHGDPRTDGVFHISVEQGRARPSL